MRRAPYASKLFSTLGSSGPAADAVVPVTTASLDCISTESAMKATPLSTWIKALRTRCPGANVALLAAHSTAGVNAAQIQAAPREYPRMLGHDAKSLPESASRSRQVAKEQSPNNVHPPATTAQVLPGLAANGEINASHSEPAKRLGGEVDMVPH
jgi:hypothetical protein